MMLYMRHNYSATLFRVKTDLQGIFVTVLYGFLGRRQETLQQSGRPIEVEIALKGDVHILERPKNSAAFTPDLQKPLLDLGYKITPSGKKKDKFGVRGYLIREPDEQKRVKAMIDVSGGKRMRLYGGVVGLGDTVDLLDFHDGIDKAKLKSTNSNAIVLHEMKMAVKAFLQLLAEALKGSISSFFVPFVLGGSVFSMVVFLALLLSGHLKA